MVEAPNKATYNVANAVAKLAAEHTLDALLACWEAKNIPKKEYFAALKHLRGDLGTNLSRAYIDSIMPACYDPDVDAYFRRAVEHVIISIENYHTYVSLGKHVDLTEIASNTVSELIGATSNLRRKMDTAETAEERSDNQRSFVNKESDELSAYGIALMEKYPAEERPKVAELGGCACGYCRLWAVLGLTREEQAKEVPNVQTLLSSLLKE